MLCKQKPEEGRREWDLRLWDIAEIPGQKGLGFQFIEK